MTSEWRERLRLAVELTGRSQMAIAEQAGVSTETLNRILTGVHAQPRFETVVRVIHATGEHVGWVLREPRSRLTDDDRIVMREIVEFLDSRFPPLDPPR
jgi:transcriptional regulator with XRE-family HTH domain